MTMIIDGTNGGFFPSWTTAGRPASPAVGQMGYNTTLGAFDSYTAAGWTSVTTNKTAGSVLQVVNVTYSTNLETTSTSYIDTSLQTSITPSSSSNKILVMCSVYGYASRASSDPSGLSLKFLRNSTSIYTSDRGVYGRIAIASGGDWKFDVPGQFTLLDSPATTSSITYKLQIASLKGYPVGINDYEVTLPLNTCSLTLLEIAA